VGEFCLWWLNLLGRFRFASAGRARRPSPHGLPFIESSGRRGLSVVGRWTEILGGGLGLGPSWTPEA
jgi:hypothetical protein